MVIFKYKLANNTLHEIHKNKSGAVVNAANEKLVFGKGIAKALYEEGGHIVQEECNALMKHYSRLGIDSLPAGSATIAPSGNMTSVKSMK